MAVPPHDAAADHAAPFLAAAMVGAVQGEEVQRGELGLSMRFDHEEFVGV